MLLLVIVALACVWALARGGSLRQLGELRLRYWWLATVAVVVQWLVVAFTRPGDSFQVQLGAVGLLVTHALVLVVVWQNWHHWPMRLIGLGFLLNLVVMAANGGYMPVSPETVARVRPDQAQALPAVGERLSRTKDVLLPREQTRLWYLADALVVEHPPISAIFGRGSAGDQPSNGTFFSVGDVFIAAGVFLLIQVASRIPSTRRRQSATPLIGGVAPWHLTARERHQSLGAAGSLPGWAAPIRYSVPSWTMNSTPSHLSESLEMVLGQAAIDDEFAELLLRDPHRATAVFELSQEELSVLSSVRATSKADLAARLLEAWDRRRSAISQGSNHERSSHGELQRNRRLALRAAIARRRS
ncbi:MAG: DUF5317 family protein [Chloroflexi bacterium]|nr:DUF5317 family protein [Chloroflexota bacterium]